MLKSRIATIGLGIALLSAPAFALDYKPKGKEITLSQAVREMVVHEKPASVSFDHGKVFVEIGTDGRPNRRWARAKDVDALERAVRAQRSQSLLRSDRTDWNVSWNRISADGKVAFDIFRNFREQSEFSKTLEHADNADELFRTVVTVLLDTIEPMSLTGNIGTVYHQSSVYSGGAHEYGSGRFETYDATRREEADLRNLVDETSPLRALKKDTYMRSVARKFNKVREFNATRTLEEYAQLAKEMMMMSDLPVAWTDQPLEQFRKFALYDYNEARGVVEVRLGLEYNIEVNRGQFKQLQLRVKAKPDFAGVLASVKREGNALFMKDVPGWKRP